MYKGMKIWKGNGNTTTILFSLKGLEILHQEKREQMDTIVMEHFKSFLFHNSGTTNKQNTYKSINQLINHIITGHNWRVSPIYG